MTVRVLLIDDDALVLAGLRLLLAGDAAIEVVGQAADGAELVDAVRATRPDVILLDVRMPGLDGISALRLLKAESQPHPAVVMLTTFGAEPVVLDALRAGASGFILKHTPPERIVAAIHDAAAGESTVSGEVLGQLIARVAREPAADSSAVAGSAVDADTLAGLTEREREIAMAVADGLSNGEIAERLFLSVGSVKAHISSALAKRGLDNRVQLAIAAHEARTSR
jgi:DNA-binding NarL/FixJ family response regulator